MTTITHVAQRAGVSPVTVSRVINNAPNVSAETREKVERAISELGYVPNVVARSLRSKRTRSLALVLPDITNAFWTTVARGVEDAAHSQGYTVLLCNTDEDYTKQQRYLDLMVSQRVDGMIIAPCDGDATKLAVLREREIATVVIDRRIEGWEVDMVYADSLSGAYALTRHLLELGHTRIGMLSGPTGAPTGEDRVAGYRLALAEAGVEIDPRLIRWGGFSGPAGAQLARQLLDEGLAPTAIFAANNAIALGVIEAVGSRGLHIPQDVALVCFDDFPTVASFFPFLTVAAQPAYDMGANAAQLLLTRMESPVPLKPRRVVLPTRLIIRYSCGSTLRTEDRCRLSLPIDGLADSRISLVRPVAASGIHWQTAVAERTGGMAQIAARRGPELTSPNRPDVNRLLRVLRFAEADRIPHVELRVMGRAVYEYVLEREFKPEIGDVRPGLTAITPEAQVEFAQRLGLDAVACEIAWQLEPLVDGAVKSLADLEHLESPASLTAQFTNLERFLRAAQGSGVGVFASFKSFYANALRATGVRPAAVLANGDLMRLERVMDVFLAQGEQVIRAVCDRFAADLAFVLVSDDIADHQGLVTPLDLFSQLFATRMQQLISPAREHDLITALHSGGRLEAALAILHAVGFDAVHGLAPECNDLPALRQAWAGKLAFMGGISESLLVGGDADGITEAVRQLCVQHGTPFGCGGFVLGSVNGISKAIPPRNFVAMVAAAQRYGRREALEPAAEVTATVVHSA